VPDEDDVRAYYASGTELDRLALPLGLIEFTRTKEIIDRHLPGLPATVVDSGGGPGPYAIWLAERGYEVIHRDLMQLHVDETISRARSADVALDSQVGDARSLDLPDDIADATLLLGPLYHLTAGVERIRALTEARRVTRQDGVVFGAAISRWAARLHGILIDRVYEKFPQALSMLDPLERTGVLPPLFEGSFAGYCHRPDELSEEVSAAGLEVLDLVNVEGIAFALTDLSERLASESDRSVVLDAARAVERVPELLGLGPHLLITARVP
jgi:SAM-dependent methyltransferase